MTDSISFFLSLCFSLICHLTFLFRIMFPFLQPGIDSLFFKFIQGFLWWQCLTCLNWAPRHQHFHQHFQDCLYVSKWMKGIKAGRRPLYIPLYFIPLFASLVPSCPLHCIPFFLSLCFSLICHLAFLSPVVFLLLQPLILSLCNILSFSEEGLTHLYRAAQILPMTSQR